MTIKKHEENEDDFIYLKVRMSDALSFLNYNFAIQRLLEENKKIPAETYNKMMGLIIPKDDDRDNYYKDIIDAIGKDVILFLSKPRMKYNFSFEIKEENTDEDIPLLESDKIIKRINKYKSILSLQDMIKYPIYYALDCFFKGTEKEVCITKCYEMMDAYTQKHKKIRKLYSHYKISVISGYIAWRFGFPISGELSPKEIEDRKPTAEQIFGAVDYRTEPYRTYPKIKKRK